MDALVPGTRDWAVWQPTERATLCFVVRGDEILLIRKKRGLGAGKINGPGGKIDPGESPAACALRETEEELHVRAREPREIGMLRFRFTDGLTLECHVFRADAWDGTPTETDEAIPLWTPVDAIPFHEMWADDIHWFHHLVASRPFRGWFSFDDDRMLDAVVTVDP